MAYYYSMPTNKTFVLSTRMSPRELAEAGNFEELDTEIENLKINIVEKATRYIALVEVKDLFSVLVKKHERERSKRYAKIILERAIEAGDYNLVRVMCEMGYSTKEAIVFLDRYTKYREITCGVWGRSQDNDFGVFEEIVDDIKVIFRGRSLYFEHNGIMYRVFRFDS